MRYLLPFLLLAACNTVKEDLPGHTAIRAEALGYSFNVFPDAPDFQVVRTSFGLPRRDTYPLAVAEAVRKATGCEVLEGTLSGDFNLTRGRMTCP